MNMQNLRQQILDRTEIDVLSKSRKRPIAIAKKVFIHIARKKFQIVSEKVGEFLGLDHSTILHHEKWSLKYELVEYTFLADIYYQFFERTEKTKKEYQKEIEELKKELEEIKKMIEDNKIKKSVLIN